jgi:ferric-dicitrate binding protein FerR (iron transport regulator)
MEAPPEMEESRTRYKASHAAMVRKEKQFRIVYRVAASVAAVFLLFFGFSKFGGRLFVDETKSFITVDAQQGSIKTIVLPDSSIATVSPGSVLRYPKAFAQAERRIYLDKGEAFFEVTKNPKRPFRVQSGELQTTALGTSFTVQYDPLLKREKVNLYTGKVEVKFTEKDTQVSPAILTPGKAYEYLQGKVILSDFNADGGNPLAKGLFFDEIPFEDAMYRIASWFGTSISIADKDIKKNRISGDFNNKDIGEILSILSFSYQFQFIKTDSLNYKIMEARN